MASVRKPSPGLQVLYNPQYGVDATLPFVIENLATLEYDEIYEI